MELEHLPEFARIYTSAWCSRDPERVAALFAPNGSLRVNASEPAVGRDAIAAVARGFMTAFPDLEVTMDGLHVDGARAIYSWTLCGTNSGPGGTGQRVRIGGFEEWTVGGDGLIASSHGHFDSGEYARQLRHGVQAPCYLDEDAVRARLSMPDLIDAMQRALVEFSAGRVEQPVRSVFQFGAARDVLGLMPTYVPALPALGVKLVTVCPGNAARGLGTHQAIIVMFDPATGVAAAMLDGRYITEVRTAAVSAVSVRHLARKDARVLAILGSGVQARSHLQALALVHKFGEVRVWSPTAEHASAFARETGADVAGSAEAAVRGADVVVTVTASPTPVVRDEWVAPGTHVIAVGSCLPAYRELDPKLVARSRLVVDSRAAALKEAGDVVLGIAEGLWTADHIAAELGELPARRSDAEVTVFKSLGLAVEDIYAAHLVLNRPRRA